MISEVSLLALGALLYTLAMPPWEWAAAGWIALAPLFFVLRGKSAPRAALYGALFGVMICSGVAHWLYSAIDTYFAALTPLSLVLTALSYLFFVGMYIAVVGACSAILMRRAPRVAQWTAVPALWVVGEFARSSLFSGFSWGLLGYSQYRHPDLIQIADLTGVYGISFMLAGSGYAAADFASAIRDRLRHEPGAALPVRPLAAWAAVLGVVALYGAMRVAQYSRPAPRAIRVALVEREMPAQDRFQRIRYLKSFLGYVDATRSAVTRDSADLIVWPEFASGLYADREPSLRLQLARLAEETDSALLLGSPRLAGAGAAVRYYNSALLFSSAGEVIGSYDKMRLLPFAEYRPLGLPRMMSRASDFPGEFSAGSRSTIFSIAKASFGVMICFEATYPEFARRLAAGGAEFLVNISNDVWLAGSGGKSAAEQHFAMAAMRAVENRRAMARATMAGVTGFIDPAGRSYRTSIGVPAVLRGEVALHRELTVYTRFGDWFVALCALCSCVCLARYWRRPAGAKS